MWRRSPGDIDEKLVLGLGSRIVELLNVLGEGSNGDGRRLVTSPPGESLPEFLSQERHEGVDHGQTTLNGGVEGLLSTLLLLSGALIEDGLAVLDVCVAQELGLGQRSTDTNHLSRLTS
jgi:hypothetical protein